MFSALGCIRRFIHKPVRSEENLKQGDMSAFPGRVWGSEEGNGKDENSHMQGSAAR